MKVSIITVCYNSAKTIEQTIQSVIGQSYKNIEYIIIDGGSADGTLDVIRRYDKQIAYWVSEPDNGLYDAMNKGIRKSTGDIVGIINSDDWYADDAIAKVVECFKNDTAIELVHGNIVLVAENGEHVLCKSVDVDNETVVSWYEHPTVFIKRTAYQKYGMFDLSYKILADGELMLRFRRLGAKVANIAEPLAYFRLGGLSNAISSIRKFNLEAKRVFSELERKYRNDEKNVHLIREMLLMLRRSGVLRYLHIRMHRNKKCNFYQQLLEKHTKDKYVLWGAGSDGFMALEFFDKEKALIKCFVDSNSGKHGTKLNGIEICEPSAENLAGAYVVVMTRNYYKEIKVSLENMGFVCGRDFTVYPDFQLEIMREMLKISNNGL